MSDWVLLSDMGEVMNIELSRPFIIGRGSPLPASNLFSRKVLELLPSLHGVLVKRLGNPAPLFNHDGQGLDDAETLARHSLQKHQTRMVSENAYQFGGV